jgi:hypothetical protein
MIDSAWLFFPMETDISPDAIMVQTVFAQGGQVLTVGRGPWSERWTTFKNSSEVDRIYMAVYGTFHSLIYRISPVLVARHRYRLELGRRLPLDHPKTYDEKLMWLMLYWRHPLKSQCADKFGMRDYLKAHGYGHLLVDLLGTYENAADIDFASLPDRFVLKCTHGCGFNLFFHSKKDLDAVKVRRQLNRWLKQNYARRNGEVHYEDIHPRIVCEPFLDDGRGCAPIDYKMHCIHGKVVFTTVCAGRGPDGHGATYDHYDRDWQTQNAISKFGPSADRWHPQPLRYADMLEAAEALSAPFPFVRMDFYCVGDRILLGEMTFTPAGCLDPDLTDEAQIALGDLIQLPEAQGLATYPGIRELLPPGFYA